MAETYTLWDGKAPGAETEVPRIHFYKSLQKCTDATVVIFPGGGYGARAKHEGEGYAQLLNTFGMNAFVVDYRVCPARFPDELLDARRAVRFVRANAEKFGISKDKVAVMGSSAGGHLAAFVSTYRAEIAGEGVDAIDGESPIPNAQILCYPVISSDEAISHAGSYHNLLDDRYCARDAFSPDLIADEKTPQAFIWHTADDGAVNVINSYRYATKLRELRISCELHVFPNGAHGLGIAPHAPHVGQWTGLLQNWLRYIGFMG